MLKSAVDVAPVAFVKLAQDTAGAIDFRLMATNGKPHVDGNFNY